MMMWQPLQHLTLSSFKWDCGKLKDWMAQWTGIKIEENVLLSTADDAFQGGLWDSTHEEGRVN